MLPPTRLGATRRAAELDGRKNDLLITAFPIFRMRLYPDNCDLATRRAV